MHLYEWWIHVDDMYGNMKILLIYNIILCNLESQKKTLLPYPLYELMIEVVLINY